MAKLPYLQLYTGDILKDTEFRSVSLPARGLWLMMLCIMHEAPRRGYLELASGKPLSHDELARVTGSSSEEVSPLMKELESAGVFSRTTAGTIYNRRMVRDEKERQKHAQRQRKYRGKQRKKEGEK